MDFTQARGLWLSAQKVLVVLLLTYSAIGAARLTWQLLDRPQPVQAPTIAPATGSNNTAGSDTEALGRRLAEETLFGEFVAEPEATAVAPVEAPDTQLRLVLQAVVARGGQGEGYAVIAQRNGQSGAFGVGDTIFGQADLAAVYGDRVILDRNGRMETLRYERDDSNGTLQPLDRAANSGSDLNQSIDRAQSRVQNNQDVREQVQQMVSYVRERANADPQGLLNEVGLEPSDNGYRVTRRARQLQMAGLRPGDVVTAVNDNPVGNLAQDQALLNQILQSGGELKIAIQRGSRTFTIYQSIPTF